MNKSEKEYLYIGHYVDTEGHYILKVGTTNNLQRRRQEHIRNYRKSPQFTLPTNQEFEYDWFLPLSKYNTLRYEDRTREQWQLQNIGVFVRNDRFCCSTKPEQVSITIRKTYTVNL